MGYWLDTYVGSGTRDDSFRPRAFDDAPGATAIDFRPPGSLSGFALVSAPVALPAAPGRIHLTDDPADASAPTLRRLANALGITLTAEPKGFRRLVLAALVAGSDASPGRWNALRPSLGRWEVWLDNALLDSLPAPAGGAFAGYADNFNRADGAIAAPWNVVFGSFSISSNVLHTTTVAGDNVAKILVFATQDHWAQSDHSADSNVGTADTYTFCRGSSGDYLGYAVNVNFAGGDPHAVKLARWDALGNLTIIGTGKTVTAGTNGPITLNVSATGSTIKSGHGAYPGTNDYSITDTTIAAGAYSGLYGYRATGHLWCGFDNFVANDIAPVGAATTLRTAVMRAATW